MESCYSLLTLAHAELQIAIAATVDSTLQLESSSGNAHMHSKGFYC